MGAWTKNKVDSSLINGGQEYTRDSNPSLEQLNAITNNSFYAVNKADEALTKANSAFENNGTVVSVGGSTVPTLSFDSNPQTQINNKQNKTYGIDIGYSSIKSSGTLTQEQYNLLISDENNYLIGANGTARFSNSLADNLYYIESNYVYEGRITINKNTLGWSLDEFKKASADLSNVTYPEIVYDSDTGLFDGVVHTGSGDRVVESYISSDGNTWYKIWESGWKEFGMTISYTSVGDHEVTFPFTFSNKKYNIQLQNVYNDSGSSYFIWTQTSEALRTEEKTTIANTRVSGGAVKSTVYIEGKGF